MKTGQAGGGVFDLKQSDREVKRKSQTWIEIILVTHSILLFLPCVTALFLSKSECRTGQTGTDLFLHIQPAHFPAVSGAFMDSPYNGNTSLQTSTSNLNAGYSRPSEAEDDGKVSSDTIWLWIAVLATIGNIVVVAVVCACAF
ncbi:uncharacterized protein C14orf132 [Toxotes jaculatrix]|uniref:uncharacterized protein C14orf132 n=1 Tax=Toxotes jaculatrix TaxID=941984 RepID=UPI001B3ABB85|nr:uncharacterized protein C14orf132 [Toxotes jaculatrix]